jgi:23S rRNA (pseudouridine1915-N3)-methyltransferase
MSAVYIAAVCRRLPPWAASAQREFAKRLAGLPLVIENIKPSAAMPPQKARAAEARALRLKIPKRAEIILLDDKGRTSTSAGFAALIASARRRGATLAFVVGGPGGADESLRAAAHKIISLSPLTFSHLLARVVLLEQIYRADATLAGHPYPR